VTNEQIAWLVAVAVAYFIGRVWGFRRGWALGRKFGFDEGVLARAEAARLLEERFGKRPSSSN
jgi:hypothetical protein